MSSKFIQVNILKDDLKDGYNINTDTCQCTAMYLQLINVDDIVNIFEDKDESNKVDAYYFFKYKDKDKDKDKTETYPEQNLIYPIKIRIKTHFNPHNIANACTYTIRVVETLSEICDMLDTNRKTGVSVIHNPKQRMDIFNHLEDVARVEAGLDLIHTREE